jgi:hypothetical protein
LSSRLDARLHVISPPWRRNTGSFLAGTNTGSKRAPATGHTGGWEVFDSEDEAVRRLRVLQHEAELAQRRATALPPKVILPAGFFRVRD